LSNVEYPDPDPSINKQKEVKKTLISTHLRVIFDFLSMKTNANVPPSKSNKQKSLEIFFFLASGQPLSVTLDHPVKNYPTQYTKQPFSLGCYLVCFVFPSYPFR
jgi:hypothetical protein